MSNPLAQFIQQELALCPTNVEIQIIQDSAGAMPSYSFCRSKKRERGRRVLQRWNSSGNLGSRMATDSSPQPPHRGRKSLDDSSSNSLVTLIFESQATDRCQHHQVHCHPVVTLWVPCGQQDSTPPFWGVPNPCKRNTLLCFQKNSIYIYTYMYIYIYI